MLSIAETDTSASCSGVAVRSVRSVVFASFDFVWSFSFGSVMPPA